MNMQLSPAVFAVNREYQIMQYASEPSVMWVWVGDKKYYDESNGVLRSDTQVHRVIVPQEELDSAGSYTVCTRKIINRKPYFPELDDVVEHTYSFNSVASKENVRCYSIADAHNWVEGPVKAAKAYGDIDFLILNGDIPDHSGSLKNCITIYRIASEITGGNIPIVFARGNHDMRGLLAERFWEISPTDRGRSYYTFRLGDIWGIVLDCGEDKWDNQEEYGGTICCHEFRERETSFINEVIANAKDEYEKAGIKHRIVICHNPFTFRPEPKFDIEDDIYREWSRLLREYVSPDIMICGHKHYLELILPGDEHDHRNQPCPVMIASKRDFPSYFTGVGFEFNKKEISLTYTDSNGEILETRKIECK